MSAKNTIKIRLDITKRSRPKGKTDWARLRGLSDSELDAAALADPDNPPLTTAQLARLEAIPDTRAIRGRLGLTQREFAARFHLSLATVRDWEQGRFRPDLTARTLLRLIALEPTMVATALRRK